MPNQVEAPRFVTHSFPGSFEPHPYYPGRLDLERGVSAAAGEALAARIRDAPGGPWAGKLGPCPTTRRSSS